MSRIGVYSGLAAAAVIGAAGLGATSVRRWARGRHVVAKADLQKDITKTG